MIFSALKMIECDQKCFVYLNENPLSPRLECPDSLYPHSQLYFIYIWQLNDLAEMSSTDNLPIELALMGLIRVTLNFCNKPLYLLAESIKSGIFFV